EARPAAPGHPPPVAAPQPAGAPAGGAMLKALGWVWKAGRRVATLVLYTKAKYPVLLAVVAFLGLARLLPPFKAWLLADWTHWTVAGSLSLSLAAFVALVMAEKELEAKAVQLLSPHVMASYLSVKKLGAPPFATEHNVLELGVRGKLRNETATSGQVNFPEMKLVEWHRFSKSRDLPVRYSAPSGRCRPSSPEIFLPGSPFQIGQGE